VTRRIIRAKIEKALDAGLRRPWENLQEVFRELLVAFLRAAGVVYIRAFLASVKKSFDWPVESDAMLASAAGDNSKETRNMKPTY
jgi:replication initiation protein RepC